MPLYRIQPVGDGTFVEGYGYRVTKTLATVAATIDPIFDVVGKVMVNMMVGEVTSVVATTTSLQLTASVGSRTLCASTDIVTEIVNTLYVLTGDQDQVLTNTTQNVVGMAMSTASFFSPLFLMNDNVIQQRCDGAGTGLLQWDLYYIPLEAGAYVSASA